jgi:hypothetical protein
VLDDGSVAEENYVWLSEWQLENLNNRHTLPIDYDIYRTLQLHIAKALVPLLQIWFYASRREQRAEKRYSDLCSLLGLQCFQSPSRIKQQVGPSLDELKTKRFLSAWELVKTTDEKDFKLCLWAGTAFISAADLRSAGVPEGRRLLDGRQNGILSALTERGIREDRARQLLLNVPDDQPVLDQLEWGDAEIRRKAGTREPISNPPGFYIYLIRTNYPVPAEFETSRKRQLREEAQQRELEARREAARQELEVYERRQRYEAFLVEETDSHVAAKMQPNTVERRLRDHMRRIQHEAPQFRWPEQTLREFAWRRLREEIATELELPTFEQFAQREAGNLF